MTAMRFIRNEKDTISGARCIVSTYERISDVYSSGIQQKFAAIAIPTAPFTPIYETRPCGRYCESAHYMEHCVFSRSEDGDGGLLGKLAALGAQANAYTTYTHTLYYFSTVDHFSASLQLYLDAIRRPHLEEERVEAEREIIAAELNMYRDDPDNVSFHRLMKNLFQEHGVREDIGGTVESIRTITAEHLQTVHRNFYAPQSISLILAGDFEQDYLMDLLEILHESLPETAPEATAAPFIRLEPTEVGRVFEIVQANVSTESFVIGYKDSHVNVQTQSGGCQLMMYQLAGQLYLDSLIGTATPLYEKLYAEGVINESFQASYLRESNFAFVLISGESENPEASADAVHRALTKLSATTI